LSTRRRLSQLLLASHLGALLVFAALLLASGFGTIRVAVIGQARTEAERAVTESRKQLRDWHRELGLASDLLAEQPTLKFYVQTGQLTKARELARDFQATSDVDYLQVEQTGRIVARVGPSPPTLSPGFAFDRRGELWCVFRRLLEDEPNVSILVAERLRNRLQPGSDFVRVQIQAPPPISPESKDAWMSAIQGVAESGEAITLESVGDIAAARIDSVRAGEGTPAVILSARVSRDWVRRRILEWYASFGVSIALAFLLALALSTLVASGIAKPFARVADEAEQLGGGDLETPVPRPDTFLAEPIRLADSLEKMRVQVAKSNAAERMQREELDTVLDGVDEGILAVDSKDRIHYANKQVLELLQRPRDEIVGALLAEVIEPLEESSASSEPPSTLPAIERYTGPGLLRPLTVRRLVASGDRQVLVVREENAFEAARHMRDRILANLSHEFQTPLSAQIASIELLRDHLQQAADPVTTRLLDAQYRGTVRLSQLVENLLDSVRIESGEMRLRRQRVDLVQVIDDAIMQVQPLIALRGQQVVRNLPPGPSLAGDAQRLHSVFVNLLANANKFSHSGSKIWVELHWEAEWVTAWVEDEGPGLPPSLTVRDLFAPFRRAPNEEPSERGSGLGLAIVHAIIAAHRGQVRVEPPMHSTGARIAISLPIEAVP
jgi:signal transduction histidine kinase